MKVVKDMARNISQIVIDQNIPMAGFGLTGCGDIVIGANGLRTTSLRLGEADAITMGIMNLAMTLYRDLTIASLNFTTGVRSDTLSASIMVRAIDNSNILLMARDNGVGMVEIARLQSAADAYFQAGGTNAFRATQADLIGFFGAAPVGQQVDPGSRAEGGADNDGEARQVANACRLALHNLGLMA